MKKITLTIILPVLLFTVICSCSNNDDTANNTVSGQLISNDDCLQKHFYYYHDEKYFINDALYYDKIAIGFETASNNEILNFINNNSQLKDIVEEAIFTTDEGKLVVANFKTEKTCPEIYNFIETIKLNDKVSIASYTYQGGFDIGISPTVGQVMTYTEEFLVKVTDPNDLSALNTVAAETNTHIKTQNSYMPEWFILTANKNSMGNALEMSAYFYETGNFEAAEPNFTYLSIPPQ